MRKDDTQLVRMISRLETAERLGVSERTVDRFIKDGHLIKHKFGRSVRIAEADLHAFVARSRKA